MPRLQAAAGSLWRGLRGMVLPSRLLTAFKTAAAVTLAWLAATLLPEWLAEYRYYAALGAILSMSPTLIRSLRSGGQILAGIGLGIVVAWIAILSPLPGLPALAIVVCVGVILAGLHWLGAGQDYVAFTALFVITVGGANADEYSFGFLILMGLGAAVGFLVNLLVVPPLYLRSSSQQLSALRSRTSDLIADLASWVLDPSRDQNWLDEAAELKREARLAGSEVEKAAESRRLNPRALRAHDSIPVKRDDVAVLHRIVEHADRLAEAFGEMAESMDEDRPIPMPADALESALSSIAKAIQALGGDLDGAEFRECVGLAEESIDRLRTQSFEAPREQPDTRLVVSTIEYELGRIVQLLRSHVGN